MNACSPTHVKEFQMSKMILQFKIFEHVPTKLEIFSLIEVCVPFVQRVPHFVKIIFIY